MRFMSRGTVGMGLLMTRRQAGMRALISATARRAISSSSNPTLRSPSIQTTPQEGSPQSVVGALNPRWLSDVKERIGKCILFGLSAQQGQEAGSILSIIARYWRELMAGSEGFLTSPQRRGLFRHKIAWGDQDSMGHVNNIMYNRYAESGRVEWMQRYAEYIDPDHAEEWRNLVTPRGYGVILKTIMTEFKFPMKYPDRISVYHKLGTEPSEMTDSFIFDVLVISEKHQRIAARITEDCALYDYGLGKKTTLKPHMAAVLRQTWKLQEEAKVTNNTRLHELLNRVRKLELESWDREDAVENMGGATQ